MFCGDFASRGCRECLEERSRQNLDAEGRNRRTPRAAMGVLLKNELSPAGGQPLFCPPMTASAVKVGEIPESER